MDSVCAGSDSDTLLSQRYPDIAFHLHFSPFTPFLLETSVLGSLSWDLPHLADNFRRFWSFHRSFQLLNEPKSWKIASQYATTPRKANPKLRLEKDPHTYVNAVRISKGKQEYLHSENISEEIRRFVSSLQLDETEILYLYGTGLGYHFAALRSWLDAKEQRLLMILEDDLGAIAALLAYEHAPALLSHPRVHLHFASHPQELTSLLNDLITSFPSEHVEIAGIASYAKRKRRTFHTLRMQLYRSSTLSQALLAETLHSSHLLSKNLIKNILRWPHSFLANGLKQQFPKVPALICGAGPSLASSIELLKDVADRALIIAGGSAITALSSQGIIPHLGIALDPNFEEFERLKASASFEMLLIYATRLCADVFNTCNGSLGYLISDTGGPCERHFEKFLEMPTEPIGPELGAEALSVTSLSIALAVHMGCDPIIFNGIDLAYTGMHRYTKGVLTSSKIFLDDARKVTRASERLIKKKDIFGRPVYTLVKWVMESDCIAHYAKAHKECRFINCTQGGLGFAHIPNLPLADVMHTHLHAQQDIHGLLHTLAQQLKINCSQSHISGEIASLYQSLIRLETIATEMLSALQQSRELPTGKMALFEMDFQEEKALHCLLPSLEFALERLLNRTHYILPHLPEEEKKGILRERLIAKWTHMREAIEAKRIYFESLQGRL